ncbi:MAG: PAS domain-containing protein [Planctomycetales bacterium]|nr:PAS domain-containing protein [Planctomycetales bacterium]
MSHPPRGGNSRLLARALDQAQDSIAVLDRNGVIQFVNAAMCAMAGAEASAIVGQRCSWSVATDQSALSALLTCLAPPTSAREGRITARQLSSPPVYGYKVSGQLFVPLFSKEGGVELTLVVLGDWEQIRLQQPLPAESAVQRRQQETALTAIRSRWQTLDGLHALIGCSPAIKLAMARAQLAIRSSCNLLIHGPKSVGKLELAQGVFLSRLNQRGLQRTAGQCFPLDCAAVDSTLFDGMLEVFSGRMRADADRICHQLVLEKLEALSEDSVRSLCQWFASRQSNCVLVGLSQNATTAELASRGRDWATLVSLMAEIEIYIPPLRARVDDVEALLLHELASCCQSAGKQQMHFSADAMDLLCSYPWPNNLSQLRQVVAESVQYAVLSPSIQVGHLPTAIRTFPSAVVSAAERPEPIDLDQVLLELEAIAIRRALKLSPRNRARAARLLGISRSRLLRRIEQLRLGDQPPEAGKAQEAES